MVTHSRDTEWAGRRGSNILGRKTGEGWKGRV